MVQKQKVQAYDEALERAKQVRKYSSDLAEIKRMEEIFPELREPKDEFAGLTDFERTLADICIGWIGEEPGWKQYIKDNADVLLKIAIEKFNSVQDASFEQKSAWSKEDEDILEYIKEAVINTWGGDTQDIILDWLESLKQRHVWKPSEEQMRALHDLNLTGNISYVGQGQTLIELYNDLKKL